MKKASQQVSFVGLRACFFRGGVLKHADVSPQHHTHAVDCVEVASWHCWLLGIEDLVLLYSQIGNPSHGHCCLPLRLIEAVAGDENVGMGLLADGRAATLVDGRNGVVAGPIGDARGQEDVPSLLGWTIIAIEDRVSTNRPVVHSVPLEPKAAVRDSLHRRPANA